MSIIGFIANEDFWSPPLFFGGGGHEGANFFSFFSVITEKKLKKIEKSSFAIKPVMDIPPPPPNIDPKGGVKGIK